MMSEVKLPRPSTERTWGMKRERALISKRSELRSVGVDHPFNSSIVCPLMDTIGGSRKDLLVDHL
jgi:hypothetical protein